MAKHGTHKATVARLMAVRTFHPAPWRILGGTIVDGVGQPVDLEVRAVRDFLGHVLDDLEVLTESARRRNVTGEYRVSSSFPAPSLGHRAPSRPPVDVDRVDVLKSEIKALRETDAADEMPQKKHGGGAHGE